MAEEPQQDTSAEEAALPVLHEAEPLIRSTPERPSLRELYWMSKAISTAVTLPRAIRGNPASVLAVMLAGRELGVPPMAATRMISIINGQTVIATELKTACAGREGHEVAALREGDGWCVAYCVSHPDAPALAWAMTREIADDAGRVLRAAAAGADLDAFEATQAHRAALALDGATIASEIIVESWEGDGSERRKAEAPLTAKSNWRSYQRSMLFWRAANDLMRRHAPAVAGGMRTTEEMGGDGEA